MAIMLAGILALTHLTSGPARAQVIIDRAIINIALGNRPIENVVVRNSGTTILYVTAEADVMIDPGSKDERREPTEDLVVSPKRFAIDPGGQRTVRLLIKKPFGEKEQVYRVKFLPEERSFDPEETKLGENKSVMLKVLSGMGVLVLVDPLAPVPSLKWERNGSDLIFSNTGSVNILLTEGKACLKPDADCKELAAGRLYPGNTLQVSAAANATITYRKEVKGEFEAIVIPPQE